MCCYVDERHLIWPHSVWTESQLVSAVANWVASRRTTYFAVAVTDHSPLSSDQMRSDEVRWAISMLLYIWISCISPMKVHSKLFNEFWFKPCYRPSSKTYMLYTNDSLHLWSILYSQHTTRVKLNFCLRNISRVTPSRARSSREPVGIIIEAALCTLPDALPVEGSNAAFITAAVLHLNCCLSVTTVCNQIRVNVLHRIFR